MVSLGRTLSCGSLSIGTTAPGYARMSHPLDGGCHHRRWHSTSSTSVFAAAATGGPSSPAKKSAAAQRRLKTRSFDCTRSLAAAALLIGAEDFESPIAKKFVFDASHINSQQKQSFRNDDNTDVISDRFNENNTAKKIVLAVQAESVNLGQEVAPPKRRVKQQRWKSAPEVIFTTSSGCGGDTELDLAAVATCSTAPCSPVACRAEVQKKREAEGCGNDADVEEDRDSEFDDTASMESVDTCVDPVYTLDPSVELLLEENFLSLQRVADEIQTPSVIEEEACGKGGPRERKRRHHRRSASILFKSEESKQREAHLSAQLTRGANIFVEETPVSTSRSEHWREAGEASQRRRRRRVFEHLENNGPMSRSAGSAAHVRHARMLNTATSPSPSTSTTSNNNSNDANKSSALLGDNLIAALVAASDEELRTWGSDSEDEHHLRLETILESDDSDE